VVLRLTVVLLLVAALWALGLPGRVALDPDAKAPARGTGLPPDPVVDEAFEPLRPERGSYGIHPAPHRAAIEAIEALLYRRAPAAPGDASAVETALARLADGLLAGEGLAGRQAAMEVLAFAGRVGARADVGYAHPSLVGLRREWEPLRARVFRSAPWLRAAAPDLDLVQEPPAAASDPRSDEALRAAAAGLERLLARGRREVERLGEPVRDPGAPAHTGGGQIRAWREWSARWRDELAGAMAPAWELSPRPEAGLRAEALRALDEAHELLLRVPEGSGAWPTPSRADWEARFRAASESLARARAALARAGPRDDAPAHARR
jgi:hypothetical protein